MAHLRSHGLQQKSGDTHQSRTPVPALTGRGASQHQCTDCGVTAQHWSYDYSDPNERRAPEGTPYSLDLDHYVPRCISCHRRYDAAGA